MASDFGRKLKKLREAIGVSQNDFAKAMSVSRATISYYETGERVPDIIFVQTVWEKTGCSLEYLLGHSENMKEQNIGIGYVTGLSDSAISVLGELDMEVDTINKFIEYGEFPRFVRILELLRMDEIKQEKRTVLRSNLEDYLLFEATGIIRRMASQVEFRIPILDDPALSSNEWEIADVKFKEDFLGILSSETDAKIEQYRKMKQQKIIDVEEAEEHQAQEQRDAAFEHFEREQKDPIYRFYLKMTRSGPSGEGV